jgi:hypothetical protein
MWWRNSSYLAAGGFAGPGDLAPAHHAGNLCVWGCLSVPVFFFDQVTLLQVLYPGLFDQMVSHHQGSRRGGTYVWSRDGSFMANTILAAQREAALEVRSSLESFSP